MTPNRDGRIIMGIAVRSKLLKQCICARLFRA